MQSYILSVLGIVLVSVLIEIILPNGQTAKYIKSIFSIFVIYVLINPLIMFLKNDFDISKYIQADNLQINKSLLNNIYKDQIQAKSKDLENTLKNEGFVGVKITILYQVVEENIVLEKVKINIDNLVINGLAPNINKYQHIRQVVAQNLMIKEEDILFE